MLIRPAKFGFNRQTADSNSFQNVSSDQIEAIRKKVEEEFDGFVSVLKTNGIDFIVFQDTAMPENPMRFSQITGLVFTRMERLYFIPCLQKTAVLSRKWGRV